MKRRILACVLISACSSRAASSVAVPAQTRARSGPSVRPDSLAKALIALGPFQITRRPPPPTVTVSAPVAETTATRPALTLTGLSFGLRPLAVLEGIPGTAEPAVVAEGDTVRGLTVRKITMAGVTVSGFGATWTVLVERAP